MLESSEVVTIFAGNRMHIVHRKWYSALVLSLLLALTACGSTAPPPVTLGTAAPPFTLPTLDDASVSLSQQQGKVVIVNFWATWCTPCVSETPRLVQWQAQHGAAGLQVLGVDTLFQDSRDAVAEFVKEYEVAYPILLDDTGAVAKQWAARQLPRSFVLDRSGLVRFIKIGELTEDDFQSEVLPLLHTP